MVTGRKLVMGGGNSLPSMLASMRDSEAPAKQVGNSLPVLFFRIT